MLKGKRTKTQKGRIKYDREGRERERERERERGRSRECTTRVSMPLLLKNRRSGRE